MAHVDEQPPTPMEKTFPAGSGKLFAGVAGPLFAIYLATATWSAPFNIDALTNTLTAWAIGSSGTVFLDGHVALAAPENIGVMAWVGPAGDSAAARYPPGAPLVAAPLYAVWPQDAVLVSIGSSARPELPRVEVLRPPIAPAAIAAAASTAAAIGLIGVAVLRLGAGRAQAYGTAYLAGLGTSAWSVAADQLWQHGPGMLWIALAVVLAEHRSIAAGFAYGAAILTRPATGVIALGVGLQAAARRRSVRPLLAIGTGAATGLGLFAAYNAYVFGTLSLSAGYGPRPLDRLLSPDLGAFAADIVLAAASPTRGLLVWSPFLLVLLPGLNQAWKVAPTWARAPALGALAYVLVQLKAEPFSGGEGFFAYRYPLEALTAAGPLLFLAYREWVAPRPTAVRLLAASAAVSITFHAAGSFG